MRCNRILPMLSLLVLLLTAVPAKADTRYVNEETGFRVDIRDDADLLTEEEEAFLAEEMKPITAYGHAGFHSTDYHSGSYGNYAADYYHSLYGQESGTVFVIDMMERQITVFSDGAVYRVVTGSRAETITDNVYRMASRGDYLGCAAEAYREVEALMRGDRIAQPMKYISNALLALLLALLINFLRVRRASRLKAAEIDAILETSAVHMGYQAPAVIFRRQSRVYDPLPKGGGGGGHGGGGRSGGGGGRSGGGGSHGF